jgi:HAD superfamily hydrolase (TIGR01509 family)
VGCRGQPAAALSFSSFPTPDLVIFDCDGVLVDSEPVANRLFAEALSEIGLPLSYAEICERFVGLTLSDCMRKVEGALGRPAPDNFLDRLQERTFAALRESLTAIPGVADAIERIGLPDCVASSGEIEKMQLTLGLTGLLPHFQGRLFSADQVAEGKPHPDLFLLAASEMGVAPADCVVVEDSLPGVQAAVAAGMPVLGYAHEGGGAALSDAGAVVFDTMAKLPSLLGRPGH